MLSLLFVCHCNQPCFYSINFNTFISAFQAICFVLFRFNTTLVHMSITETDLNSALYTFRLNQLLNMYFSLNCIVTYTRNMACTVKSSGETSASGALTQCSKVSLRFVHHVLRRLQYQRLLRQYQVVHNLYYCPSYEGYWLSSLHLLKGAVWRLQWWGNTECEILYVDNYNFTQYILPETNSCYTTVSERK